MKNVKHSKQIFFPDYPSFVTFLYFQSVEPVATPPPIANVFMQSIEQPRTNSESSNVKIESVLEDIPMKTDATFEYEPTTSANDGEYWQEIYGEPSSIGHTLQNLVESIQNIEANELFPPYPPHSPQNILRSQLQRESGRSEIKYQMEGVKAHASDASESNESPPPAKKRRLTPTLQKSVQPVESVKVENTSNTADPMHEIQNIEAHEIYPPSQYIVQSRMKLKTIHEERGEIGHDDDEKENI